MLAPPGGLLSSLSLPALSDLPPPHLLRLSAGFARGTYGELFKAEAKVYVV